MDMKRQGCDMNFFQKLFAKKEIIRMRRYDIACSEIDRWLASDPKAVMIIEHISNYVNDKRALRPDKLREQLAALDKKPKTNGLLDDLPFSDELNAHIRKTHQEGLDLIEESQRLKKLGM